MNARSLKLISYCFDQINFESFVVNFQVIAVQTAVLISNHVAMEHTKMKNNSLSVKIALLVIFAMHPLGH